MKLLQTATLGVLLAVPNSGWTLKCGEATHFAYFSRPRGDAWPDWGSVAAYNDPPDRIMLRFAVLGQGPPDLDTGAPTTDAQFTLWVQE